MLALLVVVGSCVKSMRGLAEQSSDTVSAKREGSLAALQLSKIAASAPYRRRKETKSLRLSGRLVFLVGSWF